MKHIKAIIFDVDGVLINTEDTHYQAFKSTLQGLGHPLNKDQYIKYFSGKSILGGFDSFNKDFTLDIEPQEFVKRKISSTLELFEENVQFYPDTVEFIHKVRSDRQKLTFGKVDEDCKLGLCTGLEKVFIEILFKKERELMEMFSVMTTADDYKQSKPDPECYNLTLGKLDLKAGEVIGIEDSISGLLALKNAEIVSIGLTTGYSPKDLEDADLVTDKLMKLLEN